MSNLCDLTPRELEILKLIVEGYTNKEIATEIHIAEKTVEFHLHNIYVKVGKSRRIMAAIWAMKQSVKPDTGDFPS